MTRVVAVLGTGKMGGGIARRLKTGGFQISIWDRTRSKAEALDVGRVAGSPADAVRNSDLVISMLTGPEAVREVYFGPAGAFEAAGGKTVVEMRPKDRHLDGDLARRGQVALSNARMIGSRHRCPSPARSPRRWRRLPTMKESRMDWDERFLRSDELHGYVPSPPLPQAIEGIAPGRALDLACGAGRHAIFLAERGWKVHAIDGSRVGVQRMLDVAHKRGVSSRILGEVADIESPRFRIEGEHDLVCDFYFLHRPLFAEIRRALRPSGLFVAAIHIHAAPDEGCRFLLDPGELRALFLDWEIVHSRECDAAEPDHRHGTAELIARKPP